MCHHSNLQIYGQKSYGVTIQIKPLWQNLWHKTRWNQDRHHKDDGLNTHRDMAYSATCEMKAFEMQTKATYGPLHPSPSPKPSLKEDCSKKQMNKKVENQTCTF